MDDEIREWVEVYMQCPECKTRVLPHGCGNSKRDDAFSGSIAYICVDTTIEYICATCGIVMERVIVKKTITETETEVKEKTNE